MLSSDVCWPTCVVAVFVGQAPLIAAMHIDVAKQYIISKIQLVLATPTCDSWLCHVAR